MATILLVDDEKILRTLVSVALRRQHHTVIEASSGRRALTAARKQGAPIDILVAALSLPKMNGLDLAAKFIADRPLIPILLLARSPHTRKLEDRARRAGYEVVSEPFSVSDLLGEVARLLPEERVRKPAASSGERRSRSESAADGSKR